MNNKYDFFISYNHRDKRYANWIAWILEEAGYNVFIQAWDFKPGNNIILQMQKGAADAKSTIALLSNNYMLSNFTQPEWAAAFGSDPTGEARKLIPIRIEDFVIEGLLPQVLYIDLVGKDEEGAKLAILEGIQISRSKPTVAPQFPGVIPQLTRSNESKPEYWYKPWFDQRIAELESGNFAESIQEGAKIVLHLLPIESISTIKQYNIKDLSKTRTLKPIYTTGWDYKVNKDGFCTFAKWPSEDIPHSYVQFYRNGIIESIDMGILKYGDKFIPFVKFEKEIIEHIERYYLKSLKDLNVKLPIAVSINLLGISGYYVSINPEFPRDVIREERLSLPVTLINSWEDDIATALKQSFDLLWNHCGFEGSLNYDEKGNWREYRGY